MPQSWLLLCCILSPVVVIARLYSLLPKSGSVNSRKQRGESNTCSLAVFLGSGGHTSEALSLVSSLDFSRYTPRKYIISEGDSLSAQKASDLEQDAASKSENNPTSYEIVVVPRARQVHQPLITTPPTALWSLLSVMKLLLFSGGSCSFSDILLLNGPGTCFILCLAVYILRFFGIPTPRLIYVESFARVNTLSLSGKLLRPVVDRFIVQWPQLLADGKRGDCYGCLV
ncbi:glycosyltransferase family 1 [Pyrrhoderma noxium]|uniref:UDP-N-acetylglucosamine transferase subunit ALG14 n=1 Tax=Pyrrhoderma noxium TaxID=2282107 RepID=A0A286UG40_9AGAM|nr:glycosyltransferase family 1 [Pyrrhoderma noxium]